MDRSNQPSVIVDTPHYLSGNGQSTRRSGALGIATLLWASRATLFRASAYGLLVAAIIAFLIPPKYESITRLMPPDSKSTANLALMASMSSVSGSAGSGGLGMLAGDLLGMKSPGAMYVGMLRSRTVADTLVRQFDLQKVYRARYVEDARKELAANTTVAEDVKSGIITVTVTDRSPQRAAAIAHAYVDGLDTIVSRLSTGAAHRERAFLEQRLRDVKQDLDRASKTFSEFSSHNTTLDMKEQGKAMLDAAARVKGELIATESELRGLEQIYTPNNVRVRSLQARVAELQRQLDSVRGSDAPGATSPEFPSIRQLPVLGVRYAELYREARIQEAVYETLTKEFELAKIEEARETPSIRRLDDASVPERKSSPQRMLLMLLGTLFAFTATAVVIVGSAYWGAIDDEAGGKMFASEVFGTIVAGVERARATRAGLRLERTIRRFRKHRSSDDLLGGSGGELR